MAFGKALEMTLVQKIARFAREPFLEKTETISHFYWLVKSQMYYRCFFKSIGSRSRLLKPLRLKEVQNVSIGMNVLIHKHCWLQTNPGYHACPEIVIGNGSIIGNFNHITCVDRVQIGEKVLTADGVFITDHGHNYKNPYEPIIDQGIAMGRPVSIGHGSWLGENAIVMSCRIGRNCVIGANAVVISDIPDYSVAVGSPARVVRSFSPESNTWERTSLGIVPSS